MWEIILIISTHLLAICIASLYWLRDEQRMIEEDEQMVEDIMSYIMPEGEELTDEEKGNC